MAPKGLSKVFLQLWLGSGRHRAEKSPWPTTARAATLPASKLIGRERGYHG